MNARHLQRAFQALFILGLGTVATLSLLPQENLPDVPIWDKWQHLAAYAALAFTGGAGSATRRGLWLVIIGVMVYGTALEFAQTFIPDRTGSLADLAANAIGVALGVGILWLALAIAKARAGRRG